MATGRLSALALRRQIRQCPVPRHRLLRLGVESSKKLLRSFISATNPLLEKKTIKVPSMGDSITEGTIVEWTVEEGQAVQEGDVIALVETDKVTVDLKAEMDGVVTKRFGNVDDTVEVGNDLYEFDTKAEATSTEKQSSSSDKSASQDAGSPNDGSSSSGGDEKVAATSSTDASSSSAASSKDLGAGSGEHQSRNRTPSIYFLGKDGWRKVLNGEASPHDVAPSSQSSNSSAPSKKQQQVQPSKNKAPITPMYGRPRFTELEEEAMLMGGANVAPNVVKLSAGSVFK